MRTDRLDSDNSRELLQENLCYRFHDGALLDQALTHTSWANEYNRDQGHNQRLEFLGDAVLELAISIQLYDRYPAAREGALTKMRAQLVSETQLAKIAKNIGVPQALKLGRGEERQAGREKESLLADALEAVLAAIYLDGGFISAQATVAILYDSSWPQHIPALEGKDAKSQLQEICQRLYQTTPTYTLLHTSGPEHARQFEVELTLPDGKRFGGIDSSCKKAEQQAAARCLREMGQHPQS